MNLAVLLSICMCLLVYVCGIDVRLRLNNGVVFKPIREIRQTSSFWYATFVVSKPDLKVFDHILDNFENPCASESHTPFCNTFSHIFDSFNDHTQRSVARIKHYAKEISLLGNPEPGKSHSGRSRRNIFGKLIGSITGLVDESRLKILAATIDRLETGKIHNLFLELNSQADKLSSTNVLTNKRIQNLWQGVSASNQNIQKNMNKIYLLDTFAENSAHAINDTVIELSHLNDLFFIHIELDHRTNSVTELEFAYQDHVNGIHSLVEGFLPIEFVNHQKMRDTLDEVRSNLLLSDNAFQITHDDVAFYYRTKDVAFHQTAANLYIQLKIPLSRSNSAFHIYRVMSYAIPAPQTISADHNSTLFDSYSKMNNLPDFLGISTHGDTFLELSHMDIAHCLEENNAYCNHQFTTYKSAYPSCAYAIFQDWHDDVTKNCDVQLLLKHVPKPSAIYLENSQILLQSHNTSWTLTCPDIPEMQIDPCDLCLINIGCGCELHSKWSYVSATLLQCAENETASMSHILNVQMVKSFFPRHNMSHITGSRTFDSPWKAKLPDMKVQQMEFDATLAKDRAIVLDMDKVAKSHDKPQFHYASPLDQLAFTSDQNYDLFEAPFPFLAQIFTPSLIIAVCSSLGCLVLFVQLRRVRAQMQHLTIAIAATRLIPGVKAAPNFVLIQATTESAGSVESEDPMFVQNVLQSEHTPGIIMILTGLILFYLGKFILSYLKAKLFPIPTFHTDNECKILLELASDNEYVVLMVKTLPYSPTRIQQSHRQLVANVQVKMGLIRGHASIIWRDVHLHVRNRPKNDALHLPAYVNIPLGHATKTDRITRSSTFSHRLLIGQHQIFTEIPTASNSSRAPVKSTFQHITENPYECLREFNE